MPQQIAAEPRAQPSRDDAVRAECVRITRHLEALVRAGRTGPLAELRRLERSGEGPPPEAFWSLVERAGVAPVRERFWEALLPTMVRCPHRQGARGGRALRVARVAPARIERWLRLGAADARVELRKMLRRIDRVDWVNLSTLLDRWDDPVLGNRRKRAFARDYFLLGSSSAASPAHPSTPRPARHS